MDKYYTFRKMMDFMDDCADVIDADMDTDNGGMKIVGENDQETITIEVTIKKKEEDKDA